MTVALCAACALEAPYARTNPFDPGGILTLSMTGPDSAVYVGQRIHFTVGADRSLPTGPLIIAWRSSDPLTLIAGTNGEYIVTNATARIVPIEVTAMFDSVRVSRTVLVGQTAARLTLACGPAGGPAVACDATPLVVGSSLAVRATMTDSSTTPLRQPLYALQRAGLGSSDTTVARPAPNAAGNGTVTFLAVAPGTAWLRVRVDGARDSVRVVVGP